jgi:hypothetical protein
MAKKGAARRVEILEKGNIYFFYRPRVEKKKVSGPSGVQRLYMVLSPEGKRAARLTVIGQKEMPDPEAKSQRYWGFVEMIAKHPESIRDELGGKHYSTKTRGERHMSPARPFGEGVYGILRHGDHTHLVYALELPETPGDVQEDFNIEEEASYIITVKNPERGSPPKAGLAKKEKADYPRKLQEHFQDKAFANADPTELLDREGVEFVLISASDDVRKELGIQLKAENESELSADIFKELKLDKSKRPLEPLLHGEWV